MTQLTYEAQNPELSTWFSDQTSTPYQNLSHVPGYLSEHKISAKVANKSQVLFNTTENSNKTSHSLYLKISFLILASLTMVWKQPMKEETVLKNTSTWGLGSTFNSTKL
jgi:hypothetical protein